YGALDGLLSMEGVKRHRSLAADPSGRIWLTASRGLSMTDPGRADGHSAAALARVEGLTADGRAIASRDLMAIAPRRQRISLTYTGLSLSTPERVLFRSR